MTQQQSDQELLIFYTTAGCHLCELAQELFQATLNPDFFLIKEQDIADDDQLIDLYGSRIPVLKRDLNGKELGWPFDQNQLVEFLSEA